MLLSIIVSALSIRRCTYYLYTLVLLFLPSFPGGSKSSAPPPPPPPARGPAAPPPPPPPSRYARDVPAQAPPTIAPPPPPSRAPPVAPPPVAQHANHASPGNAPPPPPPPPPLGPMPPSLPVAPPSSSKPSFLSDIQKGDFNLNRVESSGSESPEPADERSTLMAKIRGGVQLKAVSGVRLVFSFWLFPPRVQRPPSYSLASPSSSSSCSVVNLTLFFAGHPEREPGQTRARVGGGHCRSPEKGNGHEGSCPQSRWVTTFAMMSCWW